MNSTIIRDWTAIDALRSDWQALQVRSAHPSIFHSWEWLAAWRAAYGAGVEPYIIVIRDGEGDIAGIAPFYRVAMKFLNLLRYRALRFMGDYATGAEYPDWLAADGQEDAIATEVMRRLRQMHAEWDLVWLTNVSGWTGSAARLLATARQNGLRSHSRECKFGAFALPATLASFEAGMSSNRRQQLRRNTRKIRAMNGIELLKCERRENLPEFLEALFDLHQQRWAAVGLDGCFRRKPAEERFYREFVPVAFDRGWLAMYGLRYKGQLKAVQFGYCYDGIFLQLQEGYDPAFEAGAGNALRHFVIENCIEMGLREYDFLGEFTEHKRRWTAECRIGYDLLIGSLTLKAKLLFLRRIWPTGRFLRQLDSSSG